MPSHPQSNQTGLQEVLVIDDHPLFCEALSMTLRSALGVPSVNVANNLSDALQMLSKGQNPDIILLDLNLPDVDGLDGLARLKAAMPDTPIIVVSSLSDSSIITSVLNEGAVGFIPKDSDKSTITKAFGIVLSGEVYTPIDYIRPNISDKVDNTAKRLASLTPQQARILRLICEGKLNKQIAFELSIAETTVKAHMTAILRKLGAHSRTKAVLIAQKAKFDTIAFSDKLL